MKKIILGIVAISFVGTIIYVAQLSDDDFQNSIVGKIFQSNHNKKKAPIKKQNKVRKLTDSDKNQLAAEKKYKHLSDHVKRVQRENYGTMPNIDLSKRNPQLDSVLIALKDPQKYPERLSVAITPKQFDYKKYKRNKSTYLNIAAPGRVNQPANPAEGVKMIERLSKYFQKVTQGQGTDLEVKAHPNCMVTFFAINGGIFENQLNSISVDSGSSGKVKVKYTSTTGVINDVNIVAVCPLNSSKAKFIVNVVLPEEAVKETK